MEVEGTGADDRFPTGADVWRRLPVEKCELIACAVERNHICMDRGARGEKGEEGRERRNRCKKIVDAKMRFAKTRPVFPCAAHANSFTRVPGRNAACNY